MIKLLIILSLFFSNILIAQDDEEIEIGIEHDKYLGEYIPLDLTFTNYDGKEYQLKDIIDKPTVLALVYYRCPGLCSPLMNNLGVVMDQAKITPGEDYQALSISFDATEDYKLAKDKRQNYLNAMETDIPDDAWRFMAGTQENIDKLTDAVGFRYIRDADSVNWVHSGALIVIAPDGKITRYLLGTSYLPFDFKMAVVEASKGVATPPVNKLLEYCFSYDPEGKKYVFNVNKVFGTLIFGAAGIFFAVLVIKGRKKKVTKKENE